jgi:Trk K+ transport system NAD-binding subunit
VENNMNIDEALRLAEAQNTSFGIEEDNNERFANALMAFRAVDSLLSSGTPRSTLENVRIDDFSMLLRLIGHEFQEVLNSRLEGGRWKTN